MSHVHRFRPGSNVAIPPLVLLHGSGGNEHELVPLADDLAPGSPILAVRGGIPFDRGYAIFHRFPDRSVDEADIASRAAILADCIKDARTPDTASPGRPSPLASPMEPSWRQPYS